MSCALLAIRGLRLHTASWNRHGGRNELIEGCHRRDDDAPNVLGMVLGDGMIVAIAGIAIGVASAFALARLLTGLLYGIAPSDPVSFLLSSIGLLVMTLVASYIPARRAARVDPISALRDK